MIGLLAIAALAIDLSSVYSTQQTEKAAADAAALAGAQDLQVAGSRALGDPETARKHALEDLAGRFGVDVPACSPKADITDCPLAGTAFHVAISTPSKTPTTSDPRSIQVTVSNPDFQLSFARLFGQNGWNVAKASVAVVDYPAKYAIITLRGTRPKGPNDVNADDIQVNGGTQVHVYGGDVGTNTSVVMAGCGSGSGSGTGVFLDPHYGIDHFDPPSGVTTGSWCTPVPKDEQIPAPIPDPKYTVPVAPSEPSITFANSAAAQDTATCSAAIDTAILNGYKPANWPTLAAKLPGGLTISNTTCYKPGIYNFTLSNLSDTHASLFEPGVYWFQSGMSMHGVLIAGYEAGAPGVAFVFTEGSLCSGPASKCAVALNNASLVAVNEGTCDAKAANGCATTARPARDWNSVSKDFSGAAVEVLLKKTGGTFVAVPESLIVTKDPECTVADVEPSLCYSHKSANTVLSLPGGGNLFVAGIQYAPTDNVSVVGSSGGSGRTGQIVAWTLFYSGDSRINQVYPGGEGNGVLRLDTVCSGGDTPCNP